MKQIKPLWVIVLLFIFVISAAQSASADQQLIESALKAFNQKQYTKANQLIDKHLANNPEDAKAQYAKAMILNRLGYYAKALQRLEIVLDLSPKNHNAAMSYGAITQQEVYRLIRANKNDEAVQVAENALEVIPQFDLREFRVAKANAYFAKGVAYFERWCRTNDENDRLKALEAWDQTRVLEPTAATQQLLSGISAFMDNNYEGAKKFFQEGAQVRPKNRYIKFWLALSSAASGENASATKELKSVADLFDNNPLLHLYLGDIYKSEKQYAESKEEYLKALELRPNDARIYTALKNLLLCSGQIDEGIAGYQHAISENPDSFAAKYRLASFLHQAGRLEEALKVYSQMAAMTSLTPAQQATIVADQAIIGYEKGDKGEKIKDLDKNQIKALEENKSPRLLIYLTYASNDLAVREKSARDALKYSGPDALWNHAEAFQAWANLESERKQGLRSMEMIYQAWRRTPAGSSNLARLSESFENSRKLEATRMVASLKGLASDSPKASAIKGQLTTLRGLNLGDPGALLNQGQGNENTGSNSIIPDSLNANLPLTVTNLVAPNSWINITGDWQL